MAYEQYTLREKWEGITGTSETKWLSVRYTPYFESEEQVEKYYELNRDFINKCSNGREVAVFRIIHDEVMVREL